MWAITIFGIFFTFWFLPAKQVFYKNFYFSLLIIPAVICWFYFFIGALYVHRKVASSVHEIEKIITIGIYGRVRHPIYSADIILAWGIFFFLPDLRVLVATIWLTFVLFLWMKLEEYGLTDKFGSKYLEYKKRVPMFIPKLFK